MEKIIDSVIKELKKQTVIDTNDKVKFTDKNYEAIPIDKQNFSPIGKKETTSKICFIDGGNQEIIKAANFSLQLIRVYYNLFLKNKIKAKKKEFFIIIKTNEQLQFEVDFLGQSFNELHDFKIDSMDPELRTGNHRIIISSIGDLVRRYAELALAASCTAFLEKGDMLVLDGHLKATKDKEKELLNAIYEKATKGITIAGLSKSTSLLTEKGNSFGALLQQIGPEGSWFYHPIVKISNSRHRVGMYFVKLHAKARRIFRLEIHNTTDANRIISTLAANAKDPIFPGYPYGLIDADKFARISNQEAEYYKTTIMARLGKKWRDLEDFTAQLDAHQILDSMS